MLLAKGWKKEAPYSGGGLPTTGVLPQEPLIKPPSMCSGEVSPEQIKALQKRLVELVQGVLTNHKEWGDNFPRLSTTEIGKIINCIISANLQPEPYCSKETGRFFYYLYVPSECVSCEGPLAAIASTHVFLDTDGEIYGDIDGC